MKYIHFIRHGQTNHNGQRIFQDDLEPLNNIGIKQSKKAAKKLNNKASIIISSPLVRAQETARIIAATLGCQIETSEILREMMNPPIIRGKPYDNPMASIAYSQWLDKMLNNKSYGLTDTENYYDLAKRAGKILKFIAERDEENIIIVSHSVVIRAIIAVAIIGKETTPQIIEKFQRHQKISNTGITSLILTEHDNQPIFKILFD